MRALLEKNEFKTSLNILDSCYTAKYQKDSSIFYMGLVHFKSGNIEVGHRYCDILTKEFPAFYDVHYLKGLMYFAKESYAKSADEFTRVIEKDPNNVKALYNRSVALGQMEDYMDAIDDLGKCIQLEPGNAQSYYSRAYWYEFTGNFTEAIKDYQTTLKLNPRNYDAYLGLAYIYQNQKDFVKACETITQAIAAGSQAAEEIKANFCK